jgi:hypothetical protein
LIEPTAWSKQTFTLLGPDWNVALLMSSLWVVYGA